MIDFETRITEKFNTWFEINKSLLKDVLFRSFTAGILEGAIETQKVNMEGRLQEQPPAPSMEK